MTRLTASVPALSLTPWSAGINIAGALAVGWGLWRASPHVAGWVIVLVLAGLAAWILRAVLALIAGRQGRTPGSSWRLVGAVLLAIMAIAGGVAAIPTQGLGVVPLVIAVLVFCGDPGVPHVGWGAIVLLGALGIAGGALLSQAGLAGSAGQAVDVRGLLAVLAGLVLAVVGGLGRRAQRVLLAERERADAEALRARATADRVAIARDLHDVLAHSLGGLVVQLDAAEALLDAGEAGRAADRVAAARRLAVEGLNEAREAVRTLREPGGKRGDAAVAAGASTSPADLAARIGALVTAHEGTGAPGVSLEQTGAPRSVSVALAEALVRAVQEGLSNARKHAPGSAVRIEIVWHSDRVECAVETPIVAGGGGAAGALAVTGGGYGLRGVRERFEALGGTVMAGVTHDRVRAARAAAAAAAVPGAAAAAVPGAAAAAVPAAAADAGPTDPADAGPTDPADAGDERFVLRVEAGA